MPAYNFQARFALDVELGHKRQTIRKKRKRPTVPGDTLYLFTGQRSNGCRRLGEHVCKSVQPITIGLLYIDVNNKTIRVGSDEAYWLARADGFDSTAAFMLFFSKQYGLPTKDLELIKW
jgi:hypothetical protein